MIAIDVEGFDHVLVIEAIPQKVHKNLMHEIDQLDSKSLSLEVKSNGIDAAMFEHFSALARGDEFFKIVIHSPRHFREDYGRRKERLGTSKIRS